MSETSIIALISLLGALVLVGSGLRGRGITARSGVVMAIVWVVIFASVAFIASQWGG